MEVITVAAQRGDLISHPQLPHILFKWGEFAEDNYAQAKRWTGEQLITEEAVSQLAKTFIGETWSHSVGMFGLEDHITTRKARASIEGLDRAMDVGEFRRRLEEIEKGHTSDNQRMQWVRTFLHAWRVRESGRDR